MHELANNDYFKKYNNILSCQSRVENYIEPGHEKVLTADRWQSCALMQLTGVV